MSSRNSSPGGVPVRSESPQPDLSPTELLHTESPRTPSPGLAPPHIESLHSISPLALPPSVSPMTQSEQGEASRPASPALRVDVRPAQRASVDLNAVLRSPFRPPVVYHPDIDEHPRFGLISRLCLLCQTATSGLSVWLAQAALYEEADASEDDREATVFAGDMQTAAATVLRAGTLMHETCLELLEDVEDHESYRDHMPYQSLVHAAFHLAAFKHLPAPDELRDMAFPKGLLGDITRAQDKAKQLWQGNEMIDLVGWKEI